MQMASTLTIWRPSMLAWLALVAVAFLIGFVFYDGIQYLLMQWGLPEYNYGYLIPFIALFFIWQKRDELERHPMEGSWLGVALVAFGLVIAMAGKMGAVFTVIHYAMVIVIAGFALSFLGRRGFRTIWVALLLLLFMIPLPGFFYQSLSNELQLLSSRIGVWFIQLFGISVFLEGNVIDLGTMKLQVVEACSGLRYLFPLMTLGFIAACFYKAAWWKRAVVFVSTIPITLLMNSFRIGVIGILVEYWGRSMAEGFLHDFEGWIIFMACTAVLILEMWVLTKIGRDKKPLRETFGIELPAARKDVTLGHQPIPKPFIAGIVLLAAVAVMSVTLPKHSEVVPDRARFAEFPLTLADWRGQQERMEPAYVAALNFDDYVMANFLNPEQHLVNLYVGYYATQHADKVPHSPRACIPGGGWAITGFESRSLQNISVGAGQSLQINRAIIQKGEERHLVYYWFKQRSRNVTSEYLVKWFIFWDSLTQNRSDGALVRLTTPIARGEDLAAGDRRLAAFAAIVGPTLSAYVPD